MNSSRNPEPSVLARERGSDSSIGLATWNVRGFARPDLNDLAAVLQAKPNGIFVIQELQRWQAKRLAQLLGMHHHWSFKHSPLGPLLVRFAEGLATFTVEHASRAETLDLTPAIRSTSHRRRIAQFTYLERLETDVVNIHLASHHDASARLDQLQTVLERVRERGALRCIVAGDFNAAQELSLYELLESDGFIDAWASHQLVVDPKQSTSLRGREPSAPLHPTTSTGQGFTNPTGNTRTRLDRIFVRGFSVRAALIPVDGQLWSTRSDHLPVFADVALMPDSK